jgi:hypothetical protein
MEAPVVRNELSKTLWAVLAALAAAFTPAALAASHALILTIDAYEGPSPLPGVAFDGPIAVDMAKRMGVPQGNITVRKNRELTLSGTRAAMKALDSRVQSGDQVFIYYSGHGARARDTKASSGCVESMVTVRGELLPLAEVGGWVTSLTQKAERVIFMNDSCFSGGAVTRGGAYRPKYHKATGLLDCDRPLNVRTFFEKPVEAAKPVAPVNARALYVAASADNEVSFAGPNGSVGTLAWLDCLASSETPQRKGMPLTAEELRVCAQKRIDEDHRNPPQKVTLFGNRDTLLSFIPALQSKSK